ncbi:MAG: fumarylacetoacetate hydrolase family protein [Dehalococcoidia bacterium]|jgi:2-keto-4-pentenoate hydratase/2-oxohepta-3-ene-1,7-dioic acid hydratase in catechol pathway|nr:fumarylacetoacetate hydrolase family protein [Dehalococcoidia bacterium]
MKLLFFDDFTFGALKGDDRVVDLSAEVADIPQLGPQDVIRGVINNWGTYRSKLEAAVEAADGVPVSSVRLRPPLPKPTNISCMAVNYMEDGTRDAPAQINFFTKSPLAVIGDGDTMVLTDVPATIFEGEAELALVIGKDASQVPESEAMDYIFGYINFVDGSARGLPEGGFTTMKSRDTFAPIGPYLVTADEIDDPQKLGVTLTNNGIVQQKFNTDDMAHLIPRCVEFVTSVHPLEAGDILATGTNHGGLNSFQDGDRITLEVEGLGMLSINVKDDLKRTWGRETRHDMAEKGQEGTTPQISGKYA